MADYTCIHEEQIQGQSRKIAELDTRADYKEKMIEDIKKDMESLSAKMDCLSDDVNKALLKSVQDDKDIDKRVTSLESTVHVLKWITTLLFGSGVIWIIFNFVR